MALDLEPRVFLAAWDWVAVGGILARRGLELSSEDCRSWRAGRNRTDGVLW